MEYYYVIELEENVATFDRDVIEMDRGEEKHLFIKWVSIEELEELDLKPFTVKDLLLKNKLDTFTHVIKRD